MNPPPEWQSLAERVAHLEKQNRRFKAAGMAVGIVAAAVLLMGQAAPQRTAKTIEANAFILKDANGKTRADLVTIDGSPYLRLYDAAGSTRAILSVNALGPGFALMDASGVRPLAMLAALPGESGLSIFGSAGDQYVDLGIQNGGSQLTLVDQEGFEAHVGTTDILNRNTGETRKTSAASVVLFDKDKNVIWKAP